MNAPLPDVALLQRRLDDAEAERARLTRLIRHLRAAIRGIETGEQVVELEDLEVARAARRPPLESVRLVDDGFTTRLGAGLPPGVPSPAVVPPVGFGAPAIPSVDVGELRSMTPERLDQLPFGVVTLDGGGRIIGYNDTESRLAGLPRERVIGRSFFGDVAPCARVREFEGRFRDYAEGRTRAGVETFEFVFHFQQGAQRVLILFSPGRYRGEFLMSMLRR